MIKSWAQQTEALLDKLAMRYETGNMKREGDGVNVTYGAVWCVVCGCLLLKFP